jgi:hypothetical protein
VSSPSGSSRSRCSTLRSPRTSATGGRGEELPALLGRAPHDGEPFSEHLELTVGLARDDDSHQSLIARQPLLEPVERVKLDVVPADASMRRVELAARRLGGEGAEVGSDGSRCWCCPGGGVACAGICSPLSSASLRGSPWGRATGTIAQVVDMSSCGYRDAAPRAHRRYKNS